MVCKEGLDSSHATRSSEVFTTKIRAYLALAIGIGVLSILLVHTTLDDRKYNALKDGLRRRRETLREGIRKAILRFIEKETAIDPSDPIFEISGKFGSAKGDLAERHDDYLYARD